MSKTYQGNASTRALIELIKSALANKQNTITGISGTVLSFDDSGNIVSLPASELIGPKGDKGDTGTSAGFGTPTATVGTSSGTPTVTVTASGDDTAKVFNFAFDGLKGEKGDKGDNATTTEVATTSENGLMSYEDKSKLDGIAAGAQVNQNAFSQLSIGETTIAAAEATDTVSLIAGANITITPNAEDNSVTITSKDTIYTHPTSGVIAGTYKSVSVDDKGHVTAGSNPTTLAGYGITDAAAATHTHDDRYFTLTEMNNKLALKLDATLKGTANGLAELDENGKVPESMLPSYVDDVIEFESLSIFPATGETGKIYVDTTTNKTYRWSGSTYIALSSSVVLGETSATAYRGDRGKIAYDHSQTSHAPSNAQANVIESVKVNGTAITPSSKAVNITVPTKTSELTNDSGFKTTDNNTTYTLTKSGSTITLTGSDGSTTSVTDSNTTYPVATTSANGLMSSTDKTKLDNISGVSGTSYVIKKDNAGYYIEV